MSEHSTTRSWQEGYDERHGSRSYRAHYPYRNEEMAFLTATGLVVLFVVLLVVLMLTLDNKTQVPLGGLVNEEPRKAPKPKPPFIDGRHVSKNIRRGS